MIKSFSERFEEDMRLKDFAEATRNSYLREVRRFFARTGKGIAPAVVVEEDLRNYFLHLKDERNYGTSAMKIAMSGLRFFLP